MTTRRKVRSTSARRRGVTIVETIVLMTVVASILGLAILMLQLLIKLDAEGRARVEATTALGRLSSQFREDLHAARSAEVIGPPGKSGLRLNMGANRTVEYLVAERPEVVRVESEGGKPVRREQYGLPRNSPVAMAADRDGDRQLGRLTMQRRLTRNPDEPPRSFEIVAYVGRNAEPGDAGGKP